MYNRYIPNGASYTRVVEEDAPPTQTVPPDAPPPEPDAEALESAKPASGLGKLLRGLKLDGLDTGDYFHITLTDEEDVFDAVARLRSIYPRIMRLDYDNSRTRSQTDVFTAARAESRTPLELFDELYFKQNGAELTEEQKRIVSSHIEDIWEDAQ